MTGRRSASACRVERVRTVAPGGDDRHRRAIVVIALQRCDREAQKLRNLLGDGREHLGWWRPARHERGHAP
jgi:hypothetical protein